MLLVCSILHIRHDMGGSGGRREAAGELEHHAAASFGQPRRGWAGAGQDELRAAGLGQGAHVSCMSSPSVYEIDDDGSCAISASPTVRPTAWFRNAVRNYLLARMFRSLSQNHFSEKQPP